ncbi:cytochrome P450 4V2-like isoform X2 [Aethina tumida]|uniref:cytochrome P450 4V2-like isoform X2 n=1 Tax=Aethina tumida TaxID=116153 RepID=UPI00214790C2|nr:cytochrome P450 4V2-like isoform X2 [Aethina tumida]
MRCSVNFTSRPPQMYIFILIIPLLIHCYIEIKNRRATKMLENLRQPMKLPFIGTTYKYFNKNLHVGLQNVIEEIGLPNVTWVCSTPSYTTKDVEEVKTILNNCLDKSSHYKCLNFAFKNSLLLAPVDEWKRNRKILAKAFCQNILDDYVPIFNDKSLILLNVLNNKREETNMYDIFQSLAMDCFLQTTMGLDYQIQQNKNDKYVNILTDMQQIAIRRICNPIMYSDFIFEYFGEGSVLKQFYRDLREFVLDIIEKRKKQIQDDDGWVKKALIDILLTQNEKELFTDEHIVYEILLFWPLTQRGQLWQTLALYSKKLHEEILNNVRTDKPIEHSDLKNLRYTEMVLNETMRIMPVVPLVARTATEDLKLGDKTIPKGTDLAVSVFNVHRDERYYKQPDKFVPERFSQEEVAKRPQHCFVPFSAGPRNCIGWKYAMMLMKTALANVVLNFEMSSKHKSVDELKLESDIILRTKIPLDCTFKPRKN